MLARVRHRRTDRNRLQILEFVVLKEFWIAKVLINPPAATLAIAIYIPGMDCGRISAGHVVPLAGIVVVGRVPRVDIGEVGGLDSYCSFKIRLRLLSSGAASAPRSSAAE